MFLSFHKYTLRLDLTILISRTRPCRLCEVKSHLSTVAHPKTGRSRNQMRSADCRPRAHSIRTLDTLPVSHHSFGEPCHGQHDPARASIFNTVGPCPKKFLPQCQPINKVSILINVRFDLNVCIPYYCLSRRLSGSPAGMVSRFPFCFAATALFRALHLLPRLLQKSLSTTFLFSESAFSQLESTGGVLGWLRWLSV